MSSLRCPYEVYILCCQSNICFCICCITVSFLVIKSFCSDSWAHCVFCSSCLVWVCFFFLPVFPTGAFFWVFYLVICSEPIEAEQVGWHMHKEMIGHVCAAATSEHDASAHLSNDSHESCSGVGWGAFWWSYRGVLKRSSFFCWCKI